MSWSPERVQLLRKLWDENKTADEIGAGMGLGRGAVLAKAHRLGLPSRRDLTTEQKFDRLVAIVTDAPLDRPVTIKDASRIVGMRFSVAKVMWDAVCQHMRGEPGAGGEHVARPAS